MGSFKMFMLNTIKLARYNMRIIFGGKFIYFILAALIFFILFGIIVALDKGEIQIADAYSLLAFPAILMVFYPTAFGIQNDADQRTLEIIFGIPDYRYKIWLVRLVMVLILVFFLLFPFAGLAYYALVSFPVLNMIMHLMVLVTFTSTLGFVVSTIVKNGNATAVVMVIFGLVFLILGEELDESKWNVILNPYRIGDMNELVWLEIVRQNRLILGGGSIVFLLLGLLNLQHREKFL